MGDWTIIIRTALASLMGALSLAASFCSVDGDAGQSPHEPIVASVSDEPARAQVSDEPPACPSNRKPAGSDQPRIEPAIADAIQDARRIHGNLLEGTALHDATAAAIETDEFSAALGRVAQEGETASAGPIPLEPAHAPSFAPYTTSPEGSVLLRQAARELELRASDNEDLRQFEEADRLRRLSTKLRREARRWDERSQLTD